MSNKIFEAELDQFSVAIKYWVRARVISIRNKSIPTNNDVYVTKVTNRLLSELRYYLKMKFRKLLFKFRALF